MKIARRNLFQGLLIIILGVFLGKRLGGVGIDPARIDPALSTWLDGISINTDSKPWPNSNPWPKTGYRRN